VAKITPVGNGESGLSARNKINTAIESVDTDATLTGDGNSATPLSVDVTNLPAADVKSVYESNANTNEFTDAEKTKLGTVSSGATETNTVNVEAAGALMDGDYSVNGLQVRTAVGAYTTRSVVDAGSGKVSITNSDGVAGDVTLDINEAALDHGTMAGLTDDTHPQYTSLNGRAGGQVVYGGTGPGEGFTLNSTTDPVKGEVFLDGFPIKRNIANNGNTGLIDGGALSVNADPTLFDVAAGNGQIIDSATDPNAPSAALVSWPAITGISVTNLATAEFTHVYMNSSGQVIQSVSMPTPESRRDSIYLGKLVHPDNVSLFAASSQPEVIINPLNCVADFWLSLGLLNISGNKISANGANLSIDRSAGTVHQVGVNYQANKQKPNIRDLAAATPITFRYRTQTSVESTNTTVLDPTVYDNGGTVTAIPGSNNQATNVRVYMFNAGGIRIQYGQQVYATLAAAVEALTTEPFVVEQNIADNGVLLGVVSVTKGATALNNTAEAKFSPASKFGEIAAGTGSSSVSTLQNAYDNSISPEIIVDAVRGGLTIRDADTPINAPLFEVESSLGATRHFSVDGTGRTLINTSTGAHQVDIEGDVFVNYVATATEANAFEIDVDAAGFGGIRAVDVVYVTGAQQANAEEDVMLLNIDESASVSGEIVGLNVLATQGSASVHAVAVGVGVAPILQASGGFGNMDSALVNATDRLTEFLNAGNDIEFFSAVNDTVTIGHSAQFSELEFLLATTASQNCLITFEYSTGVGTWAEFFPTDGTNGMTNSGVIAWLASNTATWTPGTGGEYLIRLTRTRNGLNTPPVESLVQISSPVLYEWDKDGDVNVRNLSVEDDTSLRNTEIYNSIPPTASVTDGVILYAEDVSASSELRVRDEAGNVTTLSPHNFSGISEGASEDMAWAYYSEKDGNYINVDMLKLARVLEELSGEKLVYTGKV